MTDDKMIGANIRTARCTANMTQRELADLLSIGEVSLSKIELGRTSVRATMICKVAAIFSIPVGMLLEPTVPPESLFAARQLATVTRIFKSLPDDTRAAIARVIAVCGRENKAIRGV